MLGGQKRAQEVPGAYPYPLFLLYRQNLLQNSGKAFQKPSKTSRPEELEGIKKLIPSRSRPFKKRETAMLYFKVLCPNGRDLQFKGR